MSKVKNGKYLKHDKIKKHIKKQRDKDDNHEYKNKTLIGNKLFSAFTTTDISILELKCFFESHIKTKVSFMKSLDDIILNYSITDPRIPIGIAKGLYIFAKSDNATDAKQLQVIKSVFGDILETINDAIFYFHPRDITKQLINVFNTHSFINSFQPLSDLLNALKSNAKYNIGLQSDQLTVCILFNSNDKKCDGKCNAHHICAWCWSHLHGRFKCKLATARFKLISDSQSKSYHTRHRYNDYNNNNNNNNNQRGYNTHNGGYGFYRGSNNNDCYYDINNYPNNYNNNRNRGRGRNNRGGRK